MEPDVQRSKPVRKAKRSKSSMSKTGFKDFWQLTLSQKLKVIKDLVRALIAVKRLCAVAFAVIAPFLVWFAPTWWRDTQSRGHETGLAGMSATSSHASVSGNSITNGVTIISQNQMGGQTAQSITNIGPVARQISGPAGEDLVAALKGLPPKRITITSPMGDAESIQLNERLSTLLSKAGWSIAYGEATFVPPAVGVKIRIKEKAPQFDILLKWMEKVRLDPTVEPIPKGSKGIYAENEIILGRN